MKSIVEVMCIGSGQPRCTWPQSPFTESNCDALFFSFFSFFPSLPSSLLSLLEQYLQKQLNDSKAYLDSGFFSKLRKFTYVSISSPHSLPSPHFPTTTAGPCRRDTAASGCCDFCTIIFTPDLLQSLLLLLKPTSTQYSIRHSAWGPPHLQGPPKYLNFDLCQKKRS